ncbi:hypothetical protein FQN50_000656 [Emmonsiellopsis sp. PD_5]|nr:hypothetical protein FQN50_000656 [Emmonsiellopsis sp. PD_5]
MPSLSPPPIPSPRKPGRQYTKSSSSRRVYGKRKADTPRAVLEREHPVSKEQTEKDIDALLTTVQDAVSALQLKDAHGDESTETNTEMGEKPDTKKLPHVEEARGTETRTIPHEQPMIEVCIRQKPAGWKDTYNNAKDANNQQPQQQEACHLKRKPRRSSGWIEDLKLNTYVRPILKEASSMISSRGVQRFASWARRAGDMFTVEKIAEGSYGEVYQLRIRRDIAKYNNLSKSRLARLKAYKDGVFKIIPLRAQRGVGSKKFTSVQEIVSEVQLLKLLDPIPGFARFREVHVVQGRFPETYQEAWTQYSLTKDDCLNPDPSKQKSYPDTQLWAILEMDNAGYELEKFNWSSTFQVYDIFWGVALALARAEQFAAFEHRDLHLGNICIKPTKRGNNLSDPPTLTTEQLDDSPTGFGLSGLETTIIDYSLSRAELEPDDDAPDESSADVAWSDLDKKQIFDSIGRDEDEKLLRDTYRFMRAEVYHDDLLSPTCTPAIAGQWKAYNPRTNLVWLSFLLQMLLKKQTPLPVPVHPEKRQPLGPRTTNNQINTPLSGSPSKSSKGNHVGNGVSTLHSPSSSSSSETCKLVSQLEQDLFARLQTTQDMLSIESGIEELYCAGDLVAFAIGSQWLEERNFLC